jgi:uncharacterized protein (DUF1015 family)
VPAVSPFRALRYDEAVAGPLERLVAPPYDVIDDEGRRELLERSPYNVVHLTLPDSEASAAAALSAWRADGVLRSAEPALWWVAQDYVGPDGVARTREGIAGSVQATPYAAGEVLPHERTHAGPKEGRLRLLRATRTQLEPIFLLYDAEPPVARPDGNPAMDVAEAGVRTRVWPLDDEEASIDAPFLIADGHHRYETAVAFRDEEPSASHTFAVLVSSRSPGLEIFPTHRVVDAIGREPELEPGSSDTWDPGALTLYRDGRYFRVQTDDELDARAVEGFHPSVVAYTPSADEAVAAVDRGDGIAAFLVRAPTVAQVAEFAARGETMPQKSTFFYPKLTSGLLFYPV